MIPALSGAALAHLGGDVEVPAEGVAGRGCEGWHGGQAVGERTGRATGVDAAGTEREATQRERPVDGRPSGHGEPAR